jgi:hypothetical protein
MYPRFEEYQGNGLKTDVVKRLKSRSAATPVI